MPPVYILLVHIERSILLSDTSSDTGMALLVHRTSAVLTFLQELVFNNLTVIALPLIFGIKGVWFSFLLTNVLTLFFSIAAVYLNRDNYGYGRSGQALLLR